MLLAVLLALPLAGPAAAGSYPANAGALNVRDYGARGNGRNDDTAAFLAALAASGGDTGASFWHDRVVFVPDGTYLISAPLLKRYANGKFASGFILLGESEAGTILKLADATPGYGDPQHPMAVIFTTSKLLSGSPTDGNKDYTGRGEGNDAYMNFVEDITIDVGSGNPGAIAIDFLGNNSDAIRNVTLTAGTGSGLVGLSMTRKWPGPTLVQNLTVNGFATGIATAQTEYGLTFEHIRLSSQTSAAIVNDQNALTFRDLQISGANARILNRGDKAFLAVDGGSAPGAGIADVLQNDAYAVLRDFAVSGTRQNVILQADAQPQPLVTPSWHLALQEPPVAPSPPTDRWVSVATYGATGNPSEDATTALRSAFASGAAVIYLPNGTYPVSANIDVPASVERIVGMNSTIVPYSPRPWTFSRDNGIFRAATAGAPLTIERLAFDTAGTGLQVGVELSGSRDIVLRDVVSAGVTMLDRRATGGQAFLDNMCCGLLRITGSQPVFARQFDSEGTTTRIINQGSPLVILGLKTEGVTTILDNQAGARSEIFGGLIYVVRDGADASVPAFRNVGSWLSATLVEESLRSGSRYQTYIGRSPDDPQGSLPVTGFPARGYGRFVPGLQDAPSQ
ncbi:glycosyl hydrolase family 28-related protein [Radicibacter daui]|uniref:glycosyl hydrolase family 28-related protein n=1 Tax=Radicibacter daui TaxID=3064829 RepID=UPI004046C8FE